VAHGVTLELTWPDHPDFPPYGDPDREGGQQVSQDGFSAMPAFGPDSPSPLTEEEIVAVVRYEREILSGEIESALASDEIDEGGTSEAPENEAQSEGGDTGGGESSEGGDTGG